MDPALEEVLVEGNPDDEIEALVRLRDPTCIPNYVRIVCSFPPVYTIRLKRRMIRTVREDPCVLSLKAAQFVSLPRDVQAPIRQSDKARSFDTMTENLGRSSPTGEGVYLGIIDFGCDFRHDAYRFSDGTSRIKSFWIQGADYDQVNKFGYGKVIRQPDISQALKTESPFDSVGYRPHRSGINHGTHVGGIAARIAPGSELIVVELSTGRLPGMSSLADTNRIVEALAWIIDEAAGSPCSINMSVGSSAGSAHMGCSLVEQAIDACLLKYENVCFTQSAGNYRDSRTHASGILKPEGRRRLLWHVDPADITPNELEIWYTGQDVFEIQLRSPDGDNRYVSNVGDKIRLTAEGAVIGSFHHRKGEPNTGLTEVKIFLYPNAQPGPWQVELIGKTVNHGQYHCWIERDGGCRNCQSRFDEDDVDLRFTTGTIANSRYAISVGAYEATDQGMIVAPFSSMGPTTDGRIKPEIVAEGVNIWSASPEDSGESNTSGPWALQSGTSMASPHVAGAVALALQVAGRPLKIEEIRRLVIESASKIEGPRERVGYGALNIERLVAMAKETSAKVDATEEAGEQEGLFTQDDANQDLIDWAPENDSMPELDFMPVNETTQAESLDGFDDVPMETLGWDFDDMPMEALDWDIESPLDASYQAPSNQLRLPENELRTLFQDKSWSESDTDFTLLAKPGEALTAQVQPGDVLVELGPNNQLIPMTIVSHLQDPSLGETYTQSFLPGQFAEVEDLSNRSSPTMRRLTDANGFVSLRRAVLRPISGFDSGESRSYTIPYKNGVYEGNELQRGAVFPFEFQQSALPKSEDSKNEGLPKIVNYGELANTFSSVFDMLLPTDIVEASDKPPSNNIVGDVPAMVDEILKRPAKAKKVVERRFTEPFLAELLRTLAAWRTPKANLAYEKLISWSLETLYLSWVSSNVQKRFIWNVLALRGPGTERVRMDLTLSLLQVAQQEGESKPNIEAMFRIGEYLSRLIEGEVGVRLVFLMESQTVRHQVRHIMAIILIYDIFFGKRTIGQLLGNMSYQIALLTTTGVRKYAGRRYSQDDVFQAQASLLGRVVAHVKMAVDDWARKKAKAKKKASAAHGASILNFAIDSIVFLLPGPVSKVIGGAVQTIRKGIKKLEAYESGRDRPPDDPRDELSEYMLVAANLPFFHLMTQMVNNGELAEGDRQVLVEQFRNNMKAGRDDEWSRT